MTVPSSAMRNLKIAATVALAFGVLTVLAGGAALFGGEKTADVVGNAVPFVLWFNFLAGFAYVAAGAGLIGRRRWALWLSFGIVIGTLLVAIFLGLHIMRGGLFEMRTVGALLLRVGVWGAITYVAVRAFEP